MFGRDSFCDSCERNKDSSSSVKAGMDGYCVWECRLLRVVVGDVVLMAYVM